MLRVLCKSLLNRFVRYILHISHDCDTHIDVVIAIFQRGQSVLLARETFLTLAVDLI